MFSFVGLPAGGEGGSPGLFCSFVGLPREADVRRGVAAIKARCVDCGIRLTVESPKPRCGFCHSLWLRKGGKS